MARIASVLFAALLQVFATSTFAQGCCTQCSGLSECILSGSSGTKCQIRCTSGEICYCMNISSQCQGCILASTPRPQSRDDNQCTAQSGTPDLPTIQTKYKASSTTSGPFAVIPVFVGSSGGGGGTFMPEFQIVGDSDITTIAILTAAPRAEQITIEKGSLEQLGTQSPFLARVTAIVLATLNESGTVPRSMLVPRSSFATPFDIDKESPTRWKETPSAEAKGIVQRNQEEPVRIDLSVQQENDRISITALPRDPAAETQIGLAPTIVLIRRDGKWLWSKELSRGLG